jgi:hypothetical protein
VGGVPDDESDEQWSGEVTDPEDPTVAHDDIMKRLLDYQRSLRGDEEAAELPEDDAGAEVVSEPEAVESESEVAFSTEGEPVGQVVDLSVPEPATTRSTDVGSSQQLGAEPEPSLDVEPAPEPTSAAAPASEAVDPLAAPRADLEAHARRLEERLVRLSGKVAALRQSFQEMAIAADERLAAMKEEIDEVRPDTDEADTQR